MTAAPEPPRGPAAAAAALRRRLTPTSPRRRQMHIRFVTKTIHAYLDYPVALSLLALPFILGVGLENPWARWISPATGVAAFILTLLTDHATGVIRVIPYWLHVAVDRLGPRRVPDRPVRVRDARSGHVVLPRQRGGGARCDDHPQRSRAQDRRLHGSRVRTAMSKIHAGMKVIGADGVPVGTVDGIE